MSVAGHTQPTPAVGPTRPDHPKPMPDHATTLTDHGIDPERIAAVDDAIATTARETITAHDIERTADETETFIDTVTTEIHALVIDHGTADAVTGDVPDRFAALETDFFDSPPHTARTNLYLVVGLVADDDPVAWRLGDAILDAHYRTPDTTTDGEPDR